MTREEAIHFATCLKNNWTINFADMEDFCDMAIEALTYKNPSKPHNTCEVDIISRQDAIDAICKSWCYVTYGNCPHRDDGFTCDGCDDIEEIESLTPIKYTNTPINTPTDFISRADLFNELATVKASPEANEYKAEVYTVIQELPSAEASQDLAEPNKELKGSDLIRREDAIEAVVCHIWHTPPEVRKLFNCENYVRDVVEEALKRLPSAEAVQGWIPVSERLPEYMVDMWDEGVIATVEGREGNIIYEHGIVPNAWFEDGDWYVEGVKLESAKVTAWMPHPDPYIGEE